VISASRPKAKANTMSAAVIRTIMNRRSRSVVPKTSPDPTEDTILAIAYQLLIYWTHRGSSPSNLYLNQFTAYLYYTTNVKKTQEHTHQWPIKKMKNTLPIFVSLY
jgi:hypothetical protein